MPTEPWTSEQRRRAKTDRTDRAARRTATTVTGSRTERPDIASPRRVPATSPIAPSSHRPQDLFATTDKHPVDPDATPDDPLTTALVTAPQDNDDSSFSSLDPCNIMTDVTLAEALRQAEPNQIRPFQGRYTFVDLTRFREALGLALTSFDYMGEGDRGFSWMVDTLTTRQLRAGLTATLFTKEQIPQEPSLPADTATATAFKVFSIKHERYKQYKRLNEAALTLVQARFPSSLTPKLSRKMKSLPPGYTARQALDYIADTIGTATQKKAVWKTLFDRIGARTYKHGPHGPVEFFRAMLEDKTDLDILGVGSYTFDTLILTSQSAIQNSGLPKDRLLTMDEDWETQLATLETESSPTAETIWDEYTDFYTKKIQQLRDLGLDGNNSAHHTHRVDYLERALSATNTQLDETSQQLDAATLNIQQLRTDQTQLAHANRATIIKDANNYPASVTAGTVASSITHGTHPVAFVAAPTSGHPPPATGRLSYAELQRQLAYYQQPPPAKPSASPPPGSAPPGWRKFDKYC